MLHYTLYIDDDNAFFVLRILYATDFIQVKTHLLLDKKRTLKKNSFH